MGRFSLCQVCLLFCVVILKQSDAEPLYFLQNNSTTWDEARSECQRCFKDLVTVIPNTTNIIDMSEGLSSDYWIGLRKYMPPFSNFTDSSDSNSSSPGLAWTRWANGAPLAFQNWYPGWPKFKPKPPQISCCRCSCTCPAAPDPVPTSVTHFAATTEDIVNTSYLNSTDMNTLNLNYPSGSSPFASASPATPVASQCEKTPIVPPVIPDPDRDYINDSCVAMLSNGAWVERSCLDLLPFICYEDRFYGNATVSNITASTATVTWAPGPDGTSYYRLSVTYTNTSTYKVLVQNVTQPFSYTYALENLTAGSMYSVTVFAVKCRRDVYEPQSVTFYTIPNKVVNLTVTARTPTSISLSWTEPDDDVDLYVLQCNNVNTTIHTNSTVVSGLTPGTQYNFTIWAGVNDSSKWSEPMSVSTNTTPDKVSNLGVAARNSSSLTVNWTNPSGRFAGFDVLAVNVLNQTVLWRTKEQTQNSTCITGLPSGTQVNVTVTVVGVDGQEGDPVQMFSYTAPDSVFNLRMIPASDSFNVTWNYSAPVYSPFSLLLDSPADQNYTPSTTNLWFNFSSLKTATYYTVTVWSVVENTQSSPQSCSSFTLPVPPSNARVQSNSSNQLTFQWDPPANIGTGNYSVLLSSPFWGQNWTGTTNQTSYTFAGLTSGSSYVFEVRTLAGNLSSAPTTASAMTDSELVAISLAMQCSSSTPLLCADYSTKMKIFAALNVTVYNLLGRNVAWSLGNETFPNLAP